jgi:hypothetical protein
MKSGLIVSTGILLFSFAAMLFFKDHAGLTITRLESFYRSISGTKKNLLILTTCLVFVFAAHAGNIVNGYFNMDDFEVASLNRTTPLVQSLFIPHGNDHTLPLFRVEMRTFDALFGQNPMPFNIFIFILFALIPFFTYLSFKKLGLGLKSFFVFLLLFSGATGWDDMLPGFYIMTIYPQIIFFFSVMFWSCLAWGETKEKKYLLILAVSMLGALGADVSGIWVIPAIILTMLIISYAKNDTFIIKKNYVLDFFAENKFALVVVSEVIIAFAIFLSYTFLVVQPHTFLSVLDAQGIASATQKEDSWKFIPLVRNFVSLFTSGVSLSLFAPKIAAIITHPSIQGSVEKFWPLVEMLLFAGNALLFWFAVKYAAIKEKKLALLFMGIMSISILMVIVARPNHLPIPDYDYRYAGAAFYAYCLMLALVASIFLKTKKEYAAKIIVPLVIIIFSAQQAFGFQAVRTREEAKMRRAAVERLNKTLLSELEAVSNDKKDGPLVAPNLSGGHIFEQTMAGFTLSYYVLFFNRNMPLQLIQSPEMPGDNKTRIVTTVSSLRASTSPEFIEALKKSETIRSYYFSPAIMSYKLAAGSSPAVLLPNTQKEISLQKNEFDPEKLHTVGFTLFTDDTPGNVELSFSFKNDFGWEGASGKIRVDDFTPHEIKDRKRIYRIETNLLQLYVFALSKKVSHLVLSVPETKGAQVSADTMTFF